jgi:hypothetical protein
MPQGGLADAETLAENGSRHPANAGASAAHHHHDDPQLRSGNEVMRYYVHATDGDIAHAQGILVDEKTWAVRYIVVNSSNWWLGHEVLIAPEWMDDVYWAESKQRRHDASSDEGSAHIRFSEVFEPRTRNKHIPSLRPYRLLATRVAVR